MKFALVLGHSSTSKGTSNASGMTEYDFNSRLIHEVRRSVQDYVDCVVIEREEYRDLPDKINAFGPDLIISFHCNAFNTHVSGSEVLYYHTSLKGGVYAIKLLKLIVNALGLPNRDIKAICSEERGGYLLRYTQAPCLIAEPFFIDNNYDLEIALAREDLLVGAYKNFILNAAGV